MFVFQGEHGIALLKGKAVCGEESGNPDKAPGVARDAKTIANALPPLSPCCPPSSPVSCACMPGRSVGRTPRSA